MISAANQIYLFPFNIQGGEDDTHEWHWYSGAHDRGKSIWVGSLVKGEIQIEWQKERMLTGGGPFDLGFAGLTRRDGWVERCRSGRG